MYTWKAVSLSSFVFSLALYVVFILSLYVCYSVYLIFVTIIILFQSLQGYTSSMSTSFSGRLPFCVKLVQCYYCLLSLWRNKYDDDDDEPSYNGILIKTYTRPTQLCNCE